MPAGSNAREMAKSVQEKVHFGVGGSIANEPTR